MEGESGYYADGICASYIYMITITSIWKTDNCYGKTI